MNKVEPLSYMINSSAKGAFSAHCLRKIFLCHGTIVFLSLRACSPCHEDTSVLKTSGQTSTQAVYFLQKDEGHEATKGGLSQPISRCLTGRRNTWETDQGCQPDGSCSGKWRQRTSKHRGP